MRNRRGPSTLPCKIPLRTDLGEEKELPSFTVWVLPESQAEIQAWSFPEMPYEMSLCNSLECEDENVVPWRPDLSYVVFYYFIYAGQREPK